MIYSNGTPLYIIDGYNVIFNPKFRDGGGDVERARNTLVRYVEDYCSGKKVEFEIFWDGGGEATGGRRDGYRVKEFYTGAGQSADERIVRRVERLANRKRAIIVTNDRRHIASIVRHLGTQVMSVEEFLDLIIPRVNKQVDVQCNDALENEKRSANDLSVEEWLDLFRKGRKS